jgi:hypothetical protein
MQQPGPGMNPYAPPTAPLSPSSPADAAASGQCPRCNSPNVHKPSFTWWGGLLGPKLFNHTICRSCGFGFNGKTGKSNSGPIAIYLGAGILLAILIVVANAR